MRNKTPIELFCDLILGIGVQVIATFLLLVPILTPKGIPFYGDETWYLPPSSAYWYSKSIPYSWIEGVGPIVNTESMRFLLIMPLTYLIGLEYSVKFYILMTASLAGILTYFALKILAEEWKIFRSKACVRLIAFSGSLIQLLAFTNIGVVGAATAPAWPYSVLPFSFALFVRFLKKGKGIDALAFGISSIAGNTQPFWLYLMTIIGLSYVFIVELLSKSICKALMIRRITILIIITLTVNAFWLVPMAAGYLLGGSGLFQRYITEKLISFDSLLFLSHWNLLDVIMLGEHQYFFFWLHPQNYGPLNVIIPLLAATSLLVFRKNKQVLFVAAVLVIGFFLTKGVHEPGGYIYYLFAKSIPAGAGAILRNPTKFVPLVSFSYAFLVGLSIALVYEKLVSLKASVKHVIDSRLLKYGVTISLISLVLIPIAYGTLLDLHGYTWPRYKPIYVPSVYDDINDWLLQQQGEFKIMWIPCGGSYLWKPYIITGFPDLLSAKPSAQFTKVYPQPWKSTNAIGRLLAVLGVKYVIYHGDSIDYHNEEILQDLMNQKDLRIVYSSNYTYIPKEITFPIIVFQNDDYNEPIYANNLALTYGSDKTALLTYNQFNTSLWTIISIENSSIQSSQLDNAKLFIYSNSSFPPWLNDYLANSNIQLVYTLSISSLNLTEEKTLNEPYDPSYYVYNEAPLVPIGSPILERDKNVQVTFSYQLPNSVLNEGLKGAFWADFGISLVGYPHGVAPPPQLAPRYRVFEAFINNFTLIDEHSGYVTFNITIPATFQGSSVDIYATFYDESFRRISPAYFIGNFPIRGISLAKSSSQRMELHIINDSLSLNVYIPRNQEYTLAVKFNGTIHIAGTTISSNGEWAYLSPLTFERGNKTIELSTDGETYIQDLVLFSSNQKTKSLTEIFNTKTANIIDYKQISPVEWQVTVNSSEPFVLVFTEPYDPLWIAQVNGERIESAPLYSMVNGFVINQTGTLEITIKYELQKWFYMGSAISITILIICMLYISKNKIKTAYEKYIRNKPVSKINSIENGYDELSN